MRVLFFVIFFAFSHQIFSQTVLWNETFNGLSDGTTVDNGATAWSTSYSGSGTFSVQNNALLVENTENEAVWTSEVIDISTVNYAEITTAFTRFVNNGNIWLFAYFRSDPDYIRFYYKLDGGPETLFYEHISSGIEWNDMSESLSKVLKGSTVQIVVRVQTTLVESRCTFCSTWNPYLDDYYSIDEIAVSEVTTLYSRASGDWRNGNNWSVQDFSGTQTPAGYYPTRTEGAIIGDGDDISLSNNESVSFLEMHNNGDLDMNGRTLYLERGGDIVVENGGRIYDNNANSRIEVVDPFISNLEVNNTNGINIGDLVLRSNASVDIFGSGSMSFSDDLILNNDNVMTNDLSGNASFRTIFFDGDNSQLINNGSIAASVALEVNNGGDDNNSFTIQAGASLTVGNIDLSNADFILYNYGTVDQSGNLANINNASAFYNYDGATWNYGGDIFDTSTRLFSNYGTNTFSYNRAGNQNIITPQDAYSNLTISSSGTKTAQGNLEVNGDLQVLNSSTINLNGNDLTLSGDLTNNGSGTVLNIDHLTFDGSSDQDVNGTNNSAITIGGFTLNKAVGTEVDLSRPINVSGGNGTDAVFNNGTINTSLVNLLTIADNATTNGGNVNSFVDGPMVKTGNEAFVFPVGKNGYFAPIEISGLQNFDVTTQFTAEYIDGVPPFGTSLLPGIVKISGLEYWNLSRTNDPGNDAACYVSLYFMDEDHSQITDPNDLIVVHYNGFSWESFGLGSLSANSIVSSTRVSDFSPFTLGSINSSNPLPITLKEFNAKFENEEVKLNWTTYTELNNDYFTLEHSEDGIHYSEIGTVKGSGTTKIEQSYSFIHDGYINGNNYYRLSQTDYDGTNETFRPVYLNITLSEDAGDFVLYPNPVRQSNPQINLKLGDSYNQNTEIYISNSLGKVVYYERIDGKVSKLNLGNDLKAGIYILTLKNGSSAMTKKFIVN